MAGAAKDAKETRILFRNVDEPGLASMRTYKRLGGYQAIGKAFKEMAPDELLSELEESGLRGRGRRRASRWARRRASCRGATWTSTCAATPTSPSPAPSRTAS